MAENEEKKDEQKSKTEVKNREGSVQHLDRDPNDPRRVPQAKPNVSNLNEEDPEKDPEWQNPVK